MPKISIKLDAAKPQATIKFYDTNSSINLPIARSLNAPIEGINHVRYSCNNDGIYFTSLQDQFTTFIKKDIDGILKGSKGFIFARFNKSRDNNKDIFEVCLQASDKHTFQVYSQDNINIPEGYSRATSDKTVELAAHAVASMSKILSTPKVMFEGIFISSFTGAAINTEQELSLVYKDSFNTFMHQNLGERIGTESKLINNFFDTPKSKPKK